MAITDIQISEELETNAPSIKYRGNEGPKSPQEMQQKAEYDMQEYIIEFENVFPEMKKLRGTQEYMDMLEDYFRSLAKGPVLPSDEDPINPFQPKPQGPVLPDRQWQRMVVSWVLMVENNMVLDRSFKKQKTSL